MKLPEIKIFYSRLIDPFFVGYNKHYLNNDWDKWVPPTQEEILIKTKKLREEWGQYEEKILTAICNVTELKFKRNIIDVHIVSGSPRDMSNPLIISAHNSIENFINTLTHELIHKLFSDNKINKNIFMNMFPSETKITQNHIMLHAILKHVYIDILKNESKLKDNLEKSRKHPNNDYLKAWEIVEEKGYLNLIEEFKKTTRLNN
ncbi:MAG: hypothetical protein KAS02_01900 [Candidatus Pacebacteria bacterium]|nr:hypothetical protein [Candidatus Paceibacterota bacterium]